MTAPTNPPLVQTSDFSAEVLQHGTSNKAALLQAIIDASDLLEKECMRYFAPRIQTRYFDGRQWGKGGDCVGLELHLDRDLQTATSVTNGDATALTGSDYTLAPRSATEGYTIIRLLPSGSNVWTNDVNDHESIAVAGTWHYGGQWKNTGLTASAIASTSTTAITVSAATIPTGAILKIDNEFLYTETGAAANLTVSRGYLGSTAATHLDAAVVYRWESNATVHNLILRMVGVMLARYQSPLFGQAAIGDLSIPLTVDSLPDDIRQSIYRLRFVGRIGGV